MLKMGLRRLTTFRSLVHLLLDSSSSFVNVLENTFRERYLPFDLVEHVLMFRFQLGQFGTTLLKSFMTPFSEFVVAFLL